MATYFDPDESTHTDLLHSSVRSHAQLAKTAAQVEAEIIEGFTFGTENPVVALYGYKADADDANVNAELKVSLRKTIADVLSHRLRYYDTEQGAISERRGARSVSRQRPVDTLWPSGWDWRLARFRYDPPPYLY